MEMLPSKFDCWAGGKYNATVVIKSLKSTLSRTRETFKTRFDEFLASKKERDEILEELAETLILADVGLPATEKIIEGIRQKSKKQDSFAAIKRLLEQELVALLGTYSPAVTLDQPQSVVMFVGVNGGGKTTSLAKLAHKSSQEGKTVMLVAADTFRAAAQEQLSLWGRRLNLPVIRGRYEADPASVVYDALHSFKTRQLHLLLIDTAGRIHTNINLMNELEKIRRVIVREIVGAPHEVLLVLDASVGQNALIQAREFLKFSGLTGIFLTKLDGTAKGGSAISITDELHLPIKFLGVGEKEQDILPFHPVDFVEALLS